MDNSMITKLEEVSFLPNSLADPDGRVFTYKNRIFRVIWNKNLGDIYTKILNSPFAQALFQNGLITTKINSEINISEAALILEHEKISFHTVPGELTDHMFWQSCKTIVSLYQLLDKNGFSLKDAHPWNILFNRGRPEFIDFTSIVKGEQDLRVWYDEFYIYCRVPLFLASQRLFKKLAWDYRKENSIGFGIAIAKSRWFKRIFHLINPLPDFKNTGRFLTYLSEWMEKNKPHIKQEGTWSNYIQADDDDVANPKTIKDQFVLKTLKKAKPRTVLDTAANKGFFSEMAASLGASVVAFDYEQYCVDACRDRAASKNLDITAALMDFRYPIPASDIGLSIPDSLTRFKSDIVIALGLVHHLCLTQNFPVELFCRLCMSYSNFGVIMEYIYPEDIHVSNWNIDIPGDYSLEAFRKYFAVKYSSYEESEILTDGGIKRIFIHFYND
jgi:hypothetical protein